MIPSAQKDELTSCVWMISRTHCVPFGGTIRLWTDSELESYVPGLGMTSELEFGFTNISAVIQHILDFNKFMVEAKQRTSSDVEAYPFNIH